MHRHKIVLLFRLYALVNTNNNIVINNVSISLVQLRYYFNELWYHCSGFCVQVSGNVIIRFLIKPIINISLVMQRENTVKLSLKINSIEMQF